MNCPSELRLDMYLQAMADLLREPASGATASAHRCQPQRLLKRGDALVTNGDGFRQIRPVKAAMGLAPTGMERQPGSVGELITK